MGVTIETGVFESGVFASTTGLSQETTFLSLEKKGHESSRLQFKSYIITSYLLRVARGLAPLNAAELKIGGGVDKFRQWRPKTKKNWSHLYS